MKIYKAKLTTTIPLILIPILWLLGMLFLGSKLDSNLIQAFFLFLLAVAIPGFLLVSSKIVVDEDKKLVQTYLFGVKTQEFTPSSVQKITKGYILPILPKGGGFGSGIVISNRYKGKNRIMKMGANVYGQKAIDHIHEILKKDNK